MPDQKGEGQEMQGKELTNTYLKIAAGKADNLLESIGDLFEYIEEHGLWDVLPKDWEFKGKYREAEDFLDHLSVFCKGLSEGKDIDDIIDDDIY